MDIKEEMVLKKSHLLYSTILTAVRSVNSKPYFFNHQNRDSRCFRISWAVFLLWSVTYMAIIVGIINRHVLRIGAHHRNQPNNSPSNSNPSLYISFHFNSFLTLKQHLYIATYVTGFWKTDQIVTLGLSHFIGPANGYTCALYIHSAITRLGWLVCFSRAGFADTVNSQLRQWDPWRALHGRHGSEIHPSERETSATTSRHVWAYGWCFWDS